MITSTVRSRDLDQSVGPFVKIIGRIGAVFVAALGVVHTGVNTYGFALAGWQPWVEYLTFGLGLSVVAFALAFGAWSLSTPTGRAGRSRFWSGSAACFSCSNWWRSRSAIRRC